MAPADAEDVSSDGGASPGVDASTTADASQATDGATAADASPGCPSGGCAASRVVLFGGESSSEVFGDTWTWDGAAWTQLPITGPAPRCSVFMAGFGSGFVLLAGSDPFDNSTVPIFYDDTWTFDGALWSNQNVTGLPTTSSGDVMGSMGVLGGKLYFLDFDYYSVDAGAALVTSVWDGTSWTTLSIPGPPFTMAGSPMASLGGKLVMFGGQATAQTWTFDGSTWTQLDVAGPSDRISGAMATLGDKIVLFGGYYAVTPGTFYGDTWTWDGTAWTQLDVAGPSPRSGHGLVTLGEKLVLFGGVDSSGPFDDTWTWDGTAWTQQEVAGPPARLNAAMGSL
jgi:hypothetical protein